MRRVFDQHSDEGKYHLEIHYSVTAKRWEWSVFEIRPKNAVFSGDSGTLEDAQKSASASIGVTVGVLWRDIGPATELPD